MDISVGDGIDGEAEHKRCANEDGEKVLADEAHVSEL